MCPGTTVRFARCGFKLLGDARHLTPRPSPPRPPFFYSPHSPHLKKVTGGPSEAWVYTASKHVKPWGEKQRGIHRVHQPYMSSKQRWYYKCVSGTCFRKDREKRGIHRVHQPYMSSKQRWHYKCVSGTCSRDVIIDRGAEGV